MNKRKKLPIGIENFEKLPNDITVCKKFAKDFKELNEYLEAPLPSGLHMRSDDWDS